MNTSLTSRSSFKFLFLTSFIIVNIFIFSWSVVYATTDSINVGLEVTAPTNNNGGGGGGGPVPGCTDQTAINYNPNATANNGSCMYASKLVPNVTNFVSTYEPSNKRVALSWVNPVFNNFQAVRVVRKVGSIATSPNEGTLIYDGVNDSVIDTTVVSGLTYYYTAFVRSRSGNYSSGEVTFQVIPDNDGDNQPPPPPPPDCSDPVYATANPGTCNIPLSCADPTYANDHADICNPAPPNNEPPINDPFAQFPQTDATGPELAHLSLANFIFSQPQENQQAFVSGTTITINGKKPTIVYASASLFPNVLKAIGVTIVDPHDPNKTFSFLLRANSDQTAYTASIGALGGDGDYPVFIYVINYHDQTIKRISGILQVRGSIPSSGLSPLELFLKNLPVVSISSGLLAVGVASQVASLFDVYLIFLRWLASLLGLLGFKKKIKPWGTVYDAVTKRPIDPAYVTVTTALNRSKEVATAITDIDGRYGFLLPAGTYLLKVGKTHYQFPSRFLQGRSSDELYSNLYFGDPFRTDGNEVVNLNVPLDPVGFDWNEFIKSQSTFFKVYSDRDLYWTRIVRFLTVLGFSVSIMAMIITPSWLNLIVLASYIILFGWQAWWKTYHKVVGIKRRDSGAPIPFAIVRAFYADLNQEVKHVVTDALGRFYILVRPGTYYFTVEHRQPDGAYALVYRSQAMTLKKGVLSSDILI